MSVELKSISVSLRFYLKMSWIRREPRSSGYGRRLMSEGCGFESQHRRLDGHFFTYICCKNCNICLKRPKINENEAKVGPFLKTVFHQNMKLIRRRRWTPVSPNWYALVFMPNHKHYAALCILNFWADPIVYLRMIQMTKYSHFSLFS